MRHKELLFFLAKAIVLTGLATTANAANLCPTLADNADIPFSTVLRGANMPLDREAGVLLDRSSAYLGNAFYTHNDKFYAPRPVYRDLSEKPYRAYKGFWANYCTPLGLPGTDCARTHNLPKGNYIAPALTTSFVEFAGQPANPAYQIRPVFKSYQNANACTLAQIASLMGFPDSTVRSLIEGGSGLRGEYRDPGDRDRENEIKGWATAHQFPTQRALFLKDICLLERPVDLNPLGIVLDYEVWDRRSPATTTNFVRRVRNLLSLKDKKFILMTNSLQQIGTRISNGITEANANDIMQIVDHFSFIVWSGATPGGHMMPPTARQWTYLQSLNDNIAILKHGGRPLQLRKILPGFSLYDLNPKEAKQLHDELIRRKFNGLKIWNNGVSIDNECSNRAANDVLRCLITGTGDCSGDNPLLH